MHLQTHKTNMGNTEHPEIVRMICLWCKMTTRSAQHNVVYDLYMCVHFISLKFIRVWTIFWRSKYQFRNINRTNETCFAPFLA